MFDPKLFRLDGAVALVTGAGAGIGRAIAETFAGAGAAVMVSDLKAETAEATAEDIVAAGGRAAGVACSVTRETDLEAAVDKTVATFGGLTILANNAGGGGPKSFDMPMGDFRWTYELNVFSVFRLCQLAAPHMAKAGGGAILNITSMSGDNRNQRMASYGSSKAADSHLTSNIAFDLGPMNIRVNAIAPGATRTSALQSMLTPEIEATMLKHTPLTDEQVYVMMFVNQSRSYGYQTMMARIQIDTVKAELERDAQLKIAESNHRNREAVLDKCRTALFPSLEQVRALGE